MSKHERPDPVRGPADVAEARTPRLPRALGIASLGMYIYYIYMIYLYMYIFDDY